jgi:hypothetical protein
MPAPARAIAAASRTPGSVASVSMRAKYSPIIFALASSIPMRENEPSSGIHVSGGASSTSDPRDRGNGPGA